MTLIAALATLAVVFALACLGVAFGSRMFSWFGVSVDGGLERALYGSGLFFASFQALAFLLSIFGFLNPSIVIATLVVAALLAGKEWKQVDRLAGTFVARVWVATREPLTLILILSTIVFLGLDALLSTAPLVGSDAMLYHFAVPMLEMGKRWEPIFWLPFSFYTGQAHSLIQLALTLRSERLAMGSIFLAGGLTASGLFALVRNLASERWAWVASLAFLLSPMVYWQMSTSGSPDIWIAFYVTLAVLAAARGIDARQSRWWFLASIFAGAAAGVKYTSWVVPVTIVLCCLVSTRSLRQCAQCGVCSLLAGGLPLVRNAWWSGDPMFPFLTRWINPANLNPYALKGILGSLTPSDSSHALIGLVKYPLLLSLKGDSYGGFGHWYGPLVIAFCPLLFFAGRENSLWPLSGVMWTAILLTNELTAQQPRYLLSAFPLALALIFACAARAIKMKWRLVHVSVVGTIALFLLFGAASEAVYSRDFLPVVFGHEKREEFLMRMAPDYPAAALVTKSLKGAGGKAMIFLLYVYYVRVPFEVGTPGESWLVYPDKITDDDSLMRFLGERGVRWVVKSPNYPQPLAQVFQQLEDEGKLRPVVVGDASTFSTFRMNEDRAKFKVEILEVQPNAPASTVK